MKTSSEVVEGKLHETPQFPSTDPVVQKQYRLWRVGEKGAELRADAMHPLKSWNSQELGQKIAKIC